jgi:Domain of unknown function (DUF4282)
MVESSGSWSVTCPHCGAQSELPSAWIGRNVKCKACSHSFKVEIPSQDEDHALPPDFQEAPSTESDAATQLDQIVPAIDHARHRIKRTWNRAVRRQFTPSTSFWDIFDFSFKKYITPWVVRVTWAGALYMAIAYLAMIGLYTFSYAMAPEMESAVQPIQQPGVQPAPNFPRAKAPGANPGIEFKLPLGVQESLTTKVTYLLLFSVQLFGILIGLLWVRVALEGIIVLFNISMTLNSIDEAVNTQQQSS